MENDKNHISHKNECISFRIYAGLIIYSFQLQFNSTCITSIKTKLPKKTTKVCASAILSLHYANQRAHALK
jgi:hypothetical protein